MALMADVLTASRFLTAVAVIPVVGVGALDWAAVLLSVSWLTDAFDGKAARAGNKPTRLGDWDLRVDASVGVGVLLGLGIAGYMSWWVIVVVIVLLGGGTVVSGNPSPALLLLGFVYAWFLWLMLVMRPFLGWLPFATIAVIAALDWRRFTHVILPAFFNGFAALFRSDRARASKPVLDDWAKPGVP